MEEVKHSREIRLWTTGELRTLRENAQLGAVAVGQLLGRSVNCVRLMAWRQRISLRSTGERRGLVLGQPRGVSLSREIREDLVSGRVDPLLVAERMRVSSEAEICPACGVRPIEVRSTGWCTPCHMGRLTEAHLQELESIDAQRALWASRQALHRGRKAAQT